MGTDVVTTCVNVLSGTWLPLGKMLADAMEPPPNTWLEADVEDPPSAAPAVPVTELTALELVGPLKLALAPPPETSPVEPVELPTAERMNRCCKSRGFFWNSGFNSRTT